MARLLLIGLLAFGCATNKTYNVIEFTGVESPDIVGEIVEPDVSWHDVKDPAAKSGMIKKRTTTLPGFKTKDFVIQFGFPRHMVEVFFVNVSQERIRIYWPTDILPDPSKKWLWVNEVPLPQMPVITLLPDNETDPALLARKYFNKGRVRMNWNIRAFIPQYVKEGRFGLPMKVEIGKVRQEFVFWFYMKEIMP